MLQIFKKVPSKISTIMVAFDAGARAEGDTYPLGIAHMLEHMIFKGTDKRNYLDIPKEIGFLGGNFNAYTSNELVVYYISVPFENIEPAMEIISDITFNSILPEEEFVKEREVVKEEELSSQDSIYDFITDNLQLEFFEGRLSKPIIGTQESISSFTIESLRDFYKTFYTKENCIVSLSGNLSDKKAKKLMQKYFGDNDEKFNRPVLNNVFNYKEKRKKVITRPSLEHSYVCMSYPSAPISDKDEVAESIIFSILGEGMDSRLFTEVREKRGLCYSVGAYNSSFRDAGNSVIYFSTREENVDTAINVIKNEIKKLKEDLVTEEELERAKNKYRSSKYSVAESSSGMAKISLNRKFFDLKDFDLLTDEVLKITREDIKNVANKLFDESKELILICEEEE